jgi:acetyl-CoA C-acetyltransferase
MRRAPGAFGLVGANGGILSKYSVGVYSTAAADWVPDGSATLRAEVAARPRTPVTRRAEGTGTVETYTVRYDWPVRTGIVIGRLDADGSRFLALTEDPDLVGLLSEDDPLGARIRVQSTERRNQATLA